MTYHNIEDKACEAFAAWITQERAATLPTVTVYQQDETGEIVLPALLIYSEDGDYEQIGSSPTGNADLPISIELATSMGDNTKAEHAALVAAVRDLFIVDDLPASLATLDAVDNFTAQDWRELSFRNSVEDRVRKSILTGRLYCSPSDV